MQNILGKEERAAVHVLESEKKKLNIRHRTRIISVSFSSIQPTLMKINSCFPVQNIGVSASNTRYFAKCDLGAGK